MTSLDQILLEEDDYSSLSAEVSFTLQDVLLQPDQIVIENIQKEDLMDLDQQGMFDDDMFEDEQTPTDHQTPQQNNTNQVKVQTKQQQENPHLQVNQKQARKTIVKIQREPLAIINRQRRLKDLQLPAVKQIKNMSFVVLKNVTELFENPQKKGVGIPTVISATGSKFLAVGTSLGNTALFQVGVKGYKLLGSAEHRKYGQVTSISISRDNKYLVTGQEGGMLTVWDLYYYSQLKKELVTRSKILKLFFCSENEFLLNDMEGNLELYTIQKYIWVNLKSQKLLQKNDMLYYDIKVHTLQSNVQVIALCTLESVLVLSYRPQVVPIIRLNRPQELYISKLPNIEMGRCAIFSLTTQNNKDQASFNDVLCVSWSKSIFLYRFAQGSRQDTVELVYRFEQETPIYNLQFISDGVLVSLDNKYTFRSYRLQLQKEWSHQLINEQQLPEEVVYQRFLRDKSNKYIKSFNNTVISCSFNPKQKELFFICKNSIYRCRIHRWNETISEMINTHHQYLMALKICLELYHNKLNIFLEFVYITDKTIKVFCEIGRLFLNESLKSIQKLNEDRVRNIDQRNYIKLVEAEVEEVYDCLIEYMLDINCANFLFQKIYRDIIKQRHYTDEYHHKFLDCLQPFILNGQVTTLYSKDLFRQITDYFLRRGKKLMVDSLIMGLDVSSVFFEEAIQICTENKLYRALAYVCSTHGDFISPLNKLLGELRTAQTQQLQQAQQIYYGILKDYIEKLLQGKYINGKSVEENAAPMKKMFATWLTCKQTFGFFTTNIEQSYHIDYFVFLEKLVLTLNQENESKEYTHNILKQLITENNKEKEIAELFIKISSSLTLDSQQIELIITHSTPEQIDSHLSEYLYFVKAYLLKLKPQSIGVLVQKSKHLNYFYSLISSSADQSFNLLQKTGVLTVPNTNLNEQLCRYILDHLSGHKIANNIQDLLKINSQNTLVYMLEKFSLQIVNERLFTIKDMEYRYLVIRKLLKKLRKEEQAPNKTKNKNKNRKHSHYRNSNISDSDSDRSVLQSLEILPESPEKFKRRKLDNKIMEFYILCLCRYKNQKRVYYEFVCYMPDYLDNIEALIIIIAPFKFESCLGLLQQTRQKYVQAYSHFEKVYKQYFEQNYRKLIAVKHCHGRFMRRIFERMLTISQTLNNEQQWKQLLACVISPLQQRSKVRNYSRLLICDEIQDVYEKKSTHPFLMQLNQILELCLVNVSTHISINIISDFIGQHPYIFSKKLVLNSFRSTLITYSKNAYIYSLANDMIIDDQVNHFEQIYHKKIKGLIPNIQCQSCQSSYQIGQTIKVYTCNHSYHESCLPTHLQGQEIGESKIEDRCQKCIVIESGGDQQIFGQKIPDFHKDYQDNFLMKGMKGIVNIIPSMISAIPNPIGVFSTATTAKDSSPLKEARISSAEQAVFDYIAFQDTLEACSQQFKIFLDEYSRHLSKY